MTAKPIAPHTSAQIAILRPLCIFFMLYVHVNPGFDPAIHSGTMLYFGAVVVDILGRTSVAALSLVSGFLLAYGITRKDVGTLIWGRIQVLYLPMIVWSAIYMTAAMGGAILFGHTTGASQALGGLPVTRLIVEKLMFLHGVPAAEPLGFLRDLTVSSILLIFLLRIPGRAVIWCATLIIFGIVLLGAMTPIIYRPTIPLFMLAGAACYRGKGNLDIPPIHTIFATFLLAALVIDDLSNLTTAADSAQGIAFGASAANVAKRAILTVLALALGSVLVTTRTGTWLRGISDEVFLTYLCHATAISVLWAVWKREIGNETHWAYLFFFALSPVLVMAAATRMGPLLDYLPRPFQIGLRGKARTRASRYTASMRKGPNG